jgi:hypothetical protein
MARQTQPLTHRQGQAINAYEFTLKFSLPKPGDDPEANLQALAEAGCDDALAGIGQHGRLALDFTRAAPTAFAAITSALRDVRKAIPGAILVEASPDFVGLTDVAQIAGFTRQNMRKLMLAGHATFPAAVHEGSPAVWHLAKVLQWLKQTRQHDVDDALLDVALTAMQVNIVRDLRELPKRGVAKELAALIG